MTQREFVHELIDQLPVRELRSLRRFVEFLRDQGDPVLEAFRRAECNTEPATLEDLEAIGLAEEDRRHGRVISFEEAERLLKR